MATAVDPANVEEFLPAVVASDADVGAAAFLTCTMKVHEVLVDMNTIVISVLHDSG